MLQVRFGVAVFVLALYTSHVYVVAVCQGLGGAEQRAGMRSMKESNALSDIVRF